MYCHVFILLKKVQHKKEKMIRNIICRKLEEDGAEETVM